VSLTPRFALRSRSPLEALDLGLELLRAHLGPVARVLFLQLAVLLALTLPFCWRQPAWCLLALWWMLPWLDRGTLHVLSREVFGQDAGVFPFLADFRAVHRHGLLAGLLWRRLSGSAGFLLPVWQLEGQNGRGFRARARVLRKHTATTAFLLSAMTFLLSALTLFGVLGLLQTLTPRALGLNLWQGLTENFARPWFNWSFTAFGLLAVVITRPLYAAAGFALYLNRRTQLEGWDLEQAFRALATRLKAAGQVVLMLLMLAPVLRAQPAEAPAPVVATNGPLQPEAPARQQVLRLLQEDPELRRTRQARDLHYRPSGREPRWLRTFLDWLFKDRTAGTQRTPPPAWWPYLATGLQALVILGLVAALIYFLWRYLGSRQAPLALDAAYEPPEALMGLDLRPETLPEDLPGEALRRFRAGDPRGALALLYRGALAVLVQRDGLRVPASATEGDCLRAALPSLDEAPGQTLRLLTRTWMRMAYLGEAPAPAAMEALCAQWPAAFGGPL